MSLEARLRVAEEALEEIAGLDARASDGYDPSYYVALSEAEDVARAALARIREGDG